MDSAVTHFAHNNLTARIALSIFQSVETNWTERLEGKVILTMLIFFSSSSDIDIYYYMETSSEFNLKLLQ